MGRDLFLIDSAHIVECNTRNQREYIIGRVREVNIDRRVTYRPINVKVLIMLPH